MTMPKVGGAAATVHCLVRVFCCQIQIVNSIPLSKSDGLVKLDRVDHKITVGGKPLYKKLFEQCVGDIDFDTLALDLHTIQ